MLHIHVVSLLNHIYTHPCAQYPLDREDDCEDGSSAPLQSPPIQCDAILAMDKGFVVR